MSTFDSDQIIQLERAALDRWGRGDPEGFLEIMAPEVTYFDPFQSKRVTGLGAMRQLLEAITGQIRVDRYDMINPLVQDHGDTALLTFNLVSYQNQPDGSEKAVSRWNSTELYAYLEGRWQIIHSHWSFVQPELKEMVSEL